MESVVSLMNISLSNLQSYIIWCNRPSRRISSPDWVSSGWRWRVVVRRLRSTSSWLWFDPRGELLSRESEEVCWRTQDWPQILLPLSLDTTTPQATQTQREREDFRCAVTCWDQVRRITALHGNIGYEFEIRIMYNGECPTLQGQWYNIYWNRHFADSSESARVVGVASGGEDTTWRNCIFHIGEGIKIFVCVLQKTRFIGFR